MRPRRTLTPHQASDVATYVDSQVRPQDPRFVDDVTRTRAKFHDTPFSMHGQTVNGAVLGDPATTAPPDTVPAKPAGSNAK